MFPKGSSYKYSSSLSTVTFHPFGGGLLWCEGGQPATVTRYATRCLQTRLALFTFRWGDPRVGFNFPPSLKFTPINPFSLSTCYNFPLHRRYSLPKSSKVNQPLSFQRLGPFTHRPSLPQPGPLHPPERLSQQVIAPP